MGMNASDTLLHMYVNGVLWKMKGPLNDLQKMHHFVFIHPNNKKFIFVPYVILR